MLSYEILFSLFLITLVTNQSPRWFQCGKELKGSAGWQTHLRRMGVLKQVPASFFTSCSFHCMPSPLLHSEVGIVCPNYFHNFHFLLQQQKRGSLKSDQNLSPKFVKVDISIFVP